MSIKIPIETSARHIHVSQEDFQLLFGEDAQLHYIRIKPAWTVSLPGTSYSKGA